MNEPLEREAEIHQLAEVLRSAQAGAGQVCLIEGPSGIGKSRLLKACAEQAEAAHFRVARVLCSELTSEYPFGVVHNLFGPILKRADATSRAQALQGPAVLAEPVFSSGTATDEFAVLHGLYWLTLNLAEQGPLAILIDDVPWADPLSQRFFAYLAERIDDLPVALVATIRSGDAGAASPWVTSVSSAVTSPVIRPAELSRQAVRALLAKDLPQTTVDKELVDGVMQRTGGNPFFVVALTDAMRLDDAPIQSTPEQIRWHMSRRLARLGTSALALAKAGAVLGRDTPLRVVTQLAAIADDEAVMAAESLLSVHILQSSDPVVFNHSIVREAIYGGLDTEERLVLHANAAQILSNADEEPEVIAEHVLLSSKTDQSWAREALHDAGRAAARKGAPAAALRYLRRAVDATDPEAVSPSLLLEVGLAEAASGEVASLQHFERALTMVTDPREQADALFSLGAALYRFGRYGEAQTTFRRGAELFVNSDERLRFESAALSTRAHMSPTAALPADVIDLAHRTGTREIWAVQALHDSLSRPPARAAAELATRALDGGALLAARGSQCVAVHVATLALTQCNRLVEANEAADAIVRDAVDRGLQLEFAEASWTRALILHARGRLDEAAADAQAALDRHSETGNVHAHTAAAILAHCMIDRGDLDQAGQSLGYANVDALEAPFVKAYYWVASCRLHLARGDVRAAASVVAKVRMLLGSERDGNLNPTLLPWRSMAAIAAHQSGDDPACRRFFDEEIELSQSFGVPIALGAALRRRASTEPIAQSVRSYEMAVEALEGTEASLQLGRAHVGLGRCLTRRGDLSAARRHLAVALDLAHRCGATVLIADVRRELTTAGGRPRRLALTGKDSLTPTEARIARLAVQGMAARDIAERLFVSRNTVSWHLRNVYRKLNVESREQLTARWDAAG
jgi:DNA-binding CsgD family transcriptional regulator/tetratricopeptide (TPR) repeat protein